MQSFRIELRKRLSARMERGAEFSTCQPAISLAGWRADVGAKGPNPGLRTASAVVRCLLLGSAVSQSASQPPSQSDTGNKTVSLESTSQRFGPFCQMSARHKSLPFVNVVAVNKKRRR